MRWAQDEQDHMRPSLTVIMIIYIKIEKHREKLDMKKLQMHG